MVFNDDIQGTSAVTLSGIMGALKVQNLSSDKLKDLKIFIIGAGSAGIGVAHLLLLYKIKLGKNKEEASQDFFIFDSLGLLTS